MCLYQKYKCIKTLIYFMNDLPLSDFKIYKNTNKCCERYASTKIQNIKTLITFLKDMPLSKLNI